MHFRRLLLTFATVAAGCHSTIMDVDDASVPPDLVALPDLAMPDLAVPDLTIFVDLGCVPKVTSCIGLCGPIHDPCTNIDTQCGTCAMGMAYNLVTHLCEVPKTTCGDLNAECGTIRNSCGVRLSCPDCPNGKECDPNTNQCVTCQNVTCQNLGIECGRAWLGCGPTSNTTDCGPCPNGPKPVCNPFFNLCEPNCQPQSAQVICAAAKLNGIECGITTDGCGSYVDCGGCPAGQACGAQGDPGRCEAIQPPDECVAAGRVCGDITSVCGGVKINCGTCPGNQVCNQNGQCGPPCTPMTCAMLGNPACDPVADGCGGMVKCGDCPDPNLYACVNHMCCKKKMCATDYAGMCGTMLDDGCGGTIASCGCMSGMCTSKQPNVPGTCCVNTAKCAANACNSNVVDTCTGAMIPCTCANTQYCNNMNACVAKNTCATYTANGLDGQTCSNGGAFDDGTGNLLSCPCTGGRYCIVGGPPGAVAMGNMKGICCTDGGACNGACNVTKMNTCTGGNDVCGNCPNGQFCMNGVCKADFTCATYMASGMNGQVCSNGPDPNFPKGDGTNLTCPCTGGRECVSMGMVVMGASEGMCCANTAVCAANSCNTSVTDTCSGKVIPCVCDNAHYCNNMNMCVPKNTCASLGKTGLVGSGCNDNKFYGDGSGNMANNFACPCKPQNGFGNIVCAGEMVNVEGKCACTPSACKDCSENGQPDGCGGVKSCACMMPNVCYPMAMGPNGCCTPKTCGNLPMNVPPGSCGAFDDGCGGGFSCACPTVNGQTGQMMPNEKCVMQNGMPPYGTCGCTPTPCPQLGAGHHVNDGCGNPVDCGA